MSRLNAKDIPLLLKIEELADNETKSLGVSVIMSITLKTFLIESLGWIAWFTNVMDERS